MLNKIEFLREKVGFYQLLNHAYKPFHYVNYNGSYENWMTFYNVLPNDFKIQIEKIRDHLQKEYGFYFVPTSFVLSDDLGLMFLSWNYKNQYFSIESNIKGSLEDAYWFHKDFSSSKNVGDYLFLDKKMENLAEAISYFPNNPDNKSLKVLDSLYNLVKFLDSNYFISNKDQMYEILVNGRYTFDPDDIEDGTSSLINGAIANESLDIKIIESVMLEFYPHILKKVGV